MALLLSIRPYCAITRSAIALTAYASHVDKAVLDFMPQIILEVEAIRFAKFTFVVATCTYSSITSFCASAKESLSSRSTCVLSHPNAVFI